MKVIFDRISRNHAIAPLVIDCDPADDEAVMQAIYDYARPKVLSSDLTVHYNSEKHVGFLTAGMVHVAGNFWIKPGVAS